MSVQEVVGTNSSVDLRKFKFNAQHEKTNELENINFVTCFATWLKDGIYAAINISADIFMIHIQIFIPVKACLFFKGIQQSSLITNQMNKRNSFSGQTF